MNPHDEARALVLELDELATSPIGRCAQIAEHAAARANRLATKFPRFEGHDERAAVLGLRRLQTCAAALLIANAKLDADHLMVAQEALDDYAAAVVDLDLSESEARRWTMENGWEPGPYRVNDEGQRIDRTDPPAAVTGVWVCGDAEPRGLDAVWLRAYAFDDGSGVVLDEGLWELFEAGRTTSTRRTVMMAIQIDRVAERVAPDGWAFRRGRKRGDPQDDNRRWYVFREAPDYTYRDPQGHRSIEDALADIERTRAELEGEPMRERPWSNT